MQTHFGNNGTVTVCAEEVKQSSFIRHTSSYHPPLPTSFSPVSCLRFGGSEMDAVDGDVPPSQFPPSILYAMLTCENNAQQGVIGVGNPLVSLSNPGNLTAHTGRLWYRDSAGTAVVTW